MARSGTFKSSDSQAVRIPQKLQLPHSEVKIVRRSRDLIITPVHGHDGRAIFAALRAFDTLIERDQPAMQEREAGRNC